jgi:hypothetical protein
MTTQARLKELLTYNPETGEFRWSTTPRKGVRAGGIAGNILSTGHRIRIDRLEYKAHRLAWLWVYGRWPQDDIDHINGDPTDNRIANLREATDSQNLGNSKRRADNTSGFKGVARSSAKAEKWRAHLQGQYLGSFDTKEEAHAAYVAKARELYGEFANDGTRPLVEESWTDASESEKCR